MRHRVGRLAAVASGAADHTEIEQQHDSPMTAMTKLPMF